MLYEYSPVGFIINDRKKLTKDKSQTARRKQTGKSMTELDEKFRALEREKLTVIPKPLI